MLDRCDCLDDWLATYYLAHLKMNNIQSLYLASPLYF